MRVGLKSLRERVHAHVSKHSDLRGRTEPDMTEVTQQQQQQHCGGEYIQAGRNGFISNPYLYPPLLSVTSRGPPKEELNILEQRDMELRITVFSPTWGIPLGCHFYLKSEEV